MFSYSRFKHDWKLSAFPIEVEESGNYRVYARGERIPVYTCRISDYPFNRWWPGFQRPVEQSCKVSYVNLVSDEDVELEVESLTKSIDGRVMLKPYSKKVVPEKRDGKLKFTLKENGAYVLEIDDYHGLLYIFNNKPVVCEEPEKVSYYFGRGVHFPGKITLKSNESVYVDKDALVYGCIYAENAENIRIFGNGIFDDSGEERFSQHCYEPYANGNFKLYDCSNVSVEGVGFMNSAIWCINLFHCKDVLLDRINVFGQWRYNTDGVDVVNCQDVLIKGSFIHSFDDTVTVKGIDRYCRTDNRRIRIEGCVLWCDWGKTCEIGLETSADEYDDIVFYDCDILRGGNTACDIQNGDYARVKNIRFENIRLELESFYTGCQLQKSDDEKYSKKDEMEVAGVLSIRNKRFRESYAFLNLGESKSKITLGDERYASVTDIKLKDIFVYCDEKILEKLGTKCLKVKMKNFIPTSRMDGVTVEGLYLNGKKVSREDVDIVLDKVDESAINIY